jgi:hypothetical protein
MVAAIFGGIGIGAAFVSAIVGYQLTEESLSDANIKISVARSEAKAVGEQAQAEIANANKAIEDARAETAKANKATEELRRQNLELEKAFAPRMLNQLPNGEPLKKFTVQKVTILVLHDSEPRRMAGQIAMLFSLVGWPSPQLVLALDTTDGIMIEYPRPKEDSPFTNNPTGDAAEALKKVLEASEISAFAVPFSSGAPLEEGELRIRIGAKPQSMYLLRRFMPPWAIEQQDRAEQKLKDLKERLDANRPK